MPSDLPSRLRLATLLVSSAVLVAPVVAAGEEQVLFRPGAILAAGADDNLLFDGTGGDRVGKLALRLNLKTWDRLWNLDLDATAALYGFQERQQLVPLGESTLNTLVRLGHEDTFEAKAKVRGSDDALGLAQVGLLGAAGTVIGYRILADVEHHFDARWSLTTPVRVDGISFLDAPYAYRSGWAASAGVEPQYRFTRDLTLLTEVDERNFVASDYFGVAGDILPGARYRLDRRLFVELQAGTSLFHDDQGFVPVPVMRGYLDYDTRYFGLRLTASQDLAVPSGRSGVLLMQLGEVQTDYGTQDWEFRVRGGYYRSLSSPRVSDWQPGYGAQAEAYRKLASFAWIGVTALRFDRVATVYGPAMARDAIYAQIEVTEGRP